MRIRRRAPCVILAALVLLVLPAAALAQVAVYVEGAYTATDLAVYIYADITGAPLCSYGVTLYYNVNKVTPVSATKNDAVWYFGTSAAKMPYVNPDTALPGQIVFIGGKLDTGNPTAGVSGTRVLLGTARFSRVTGADTAFGIAVALGKTHPPYDNFVTTGGVVRDDTAGFGPIVIRKRGDANKDGNINALDAGVIRDIFFSGGAYSVFADCDGDGRITALDAGCVRDIFFGVR